MELKSDTDLSWECHVNDLSTKLNRTNLLLFKIRKYISLKMWKSIYFAVFKSDSNITKKGLTLL